ncbi:acyltransferase [Sphingobium sp. B2]|uniref:acyltransferase n=1 Tax=Sphingobium sp. B2 TaxID=2583228 RepID=UPI001643F33C|nr:DapH/DapD/GlmU-related protein [Sphingobium sp. B2]
MDIAHDVHIADTALIDRTWPKGVHIAQGCVFGEESVLLTHDMVRGVYRDTRVGARTIVGPRAIIMPGISIGEDCVLEPGAVVTKDMPDRSKAVGNPAQVMPL